jgi:outer membrane protein OmpA-like peptidoglycan-associated protein
MLTTRFATAAIVLMGAGCVPLTDYRKMEDRYKEQEKYIQKHKDEISEFQKREQLLTLQAKENQKELELARARLAKSEVLRKELEANRGKPIVVTDVKASSNGGTEVFGSFKINSETGGIVLEHDVLFASGQHTLKESGKKILNELVGKLNSAEFGKYCIRIDGHTDDQKVVRTVKENHDNWELGFKRAKAVFDYMVGKGISEERCFLASFGPFRPMVPGAIHHTSKKTKKHDKPEKVYDNGGRAQNRRVEIVLFEKKI